MLGQCEPFPQPVSQPLLSARVHYPADVPLQTVLAAFRKLDAEDPALGVQWNEALQELHIRIMGVIQLEVLRELVRERFGFDFRLRSFAVDWKKLWLIWNARDFWIA